MQKSKILYLLSFLVLIILDQLSKYIVRSSGGFYICNTNLAFGVKPSYFLVFILLLGLLLFLFKIGNYKLQITNYKKIQNPNSQNSKLWFRNLNFENCNLFGIWSLRFGILLIFSGAISNIIDRLSFGCVIDFIDLHFWPASNAISVAIAGWPVFNLADIYITFGAILILINYIRSKE